jgi:periplasmic protein CpxP/Spy
MKQRIYFLAVMLLFATMVTAQPPQGGPGGQQMDPEEMAKRQTDEMVKDLGLDAKQTEKVSAINKKYADKMGEMFKNPQGDRDGMREKMQAMRTEKDAELKTVFTADQFVKYQENEKKRMANFRQGPPPGAGDNSDSKRGQTRGTGDE